MNPFWTVSLFWIAAAVCVVVALAFVLPPLLRARGGAGKAARRDVNIAVYRDQMKEMEADRASGLLPEAQYQSARLELETRLADDALGAEERPEPAPSGGRTLGYALGAALPAAAFALYYWLGNPASLLAIADAQSATAHSAMAGAANGHDFMDLIRKVEEKTRANPADGEAWSMLARSYAAMERWPEALQAYERAARLLPRDASVLSGYAEALAIANRFVGFNALQEGDFPRASVYLKRMHGLLPPESPVAQSVLAALAEAERLAQPGASGLASSPPADDRPASIAAGATIRGSVDVAPALKPGLTETDVLFLFARSDPGGPPVAAIRASAGQLPLEFELDDRSAMNPGNTLSQHRQVTLVARLSRSGNPMAQPGDLEGAAANVTVGASGVKILIDRRRP
ncbi:MAG: c-type cytochrome biogenesis protein CcmI [Thiobacillus sp. SCN 63-374]|nr:MAG: c-type cytochrome biogenesis protein CcmI [Thiobacillus sp. SCN 63-374]